MRILGQPNTFLALCNCPIQSSAPCIDTTAPFWANLAPFSLCATAPYNRLRRAALTPPPCLLLCSRHTLSNTHTLPLIYRVYRVWPPKTIISCLHRLSAREAYETARLGSSMWPVQVVDSVGASKAWPRASIHVLFSTYIIIPTRTHCHSSIVSVELGRQNQNQLPSQIIGTRSVQTDIFGRSGAILFTLAPSRRACCRSDSVYRVVHVFIYCIILSILLYISLVQHTKNKYGSKLCRLLPYHRNLVDTYYKLTYITAYVPLLQNTT